jgi:hypothetical protein
MKNLDSTLLCLEIDSVALGYRALKGVSDATEVKILEASQAGKRFVILALGETKILSDCAREIAAELAAVSEGVDFRSELIDRIPPQVVEAVYNLPSQQAEEALLVIESGSVGQILSLARLLVDESKLSVIEIRFHRDGSGAHGVFTGSVSSCQAAEKSVGTRLDSGRVELLQNLSPGFRRFFNLGGQD